MRSARLRKALGLGAVGAGTAALALITLPAAAFAQPMAQGKLLPQMTITQGPSTNGANNDTNPYGMAIVPMTSGDLIAGDVLVVDFNSSTTMGGGTTIEEVNPATGTVSTFFQSSSITGPVGIAINPSNDFVWVAYYGASADGSQSGFAVIKPGAAGAQGTSYANFTNSSTNMNLFQGTWGAAFAPGAFFWTNAGAAAPTTGNTGQVWRLNPNPTGTSNGQPLNSMYTPLATSLPTSDTAGITPSTVAGPQGMVYDAMNGTLYVTDDYNNAIYAIPNALTATAPVTPVLVTMGGALNSPQNIVINPANGDLLVVNGATNNDLVEVTTSGQQVATRVLDSTPGGGGLFGLALNDTGTGPFQLYFDDSNSSTLDTLAAPGVGLALAQGDGTVQPLGYQSTVPTMVSSQKVVGIAYQAGSSGAGGWEVTANGQVMAFGTAKSYGGVQQLKLNAPIVGIASTPDGMGYWLVGADGGVFNFGDAGYYGNTYTLGLSGLTGPRPLNAPIVGIASTPDGMGYWLVGADGGVFNFGDAGYYGNTYTLGLSGLTGPRPLNAPIVGIASTPDGMGYWLVGADGGVFNFGDAGYYGNTYTLGLTGLHGSRPLNKPVTGIIPSPDGAGYWVTAADGGVFNFGDAPFVGSAAGTGLTFTAAASPLG